MDVNPYTPPVEALVAAAAAHIVAKVPALRGRWALPEPSLHYESGCPRCGYDTMSGGYCVACVAALARCRARVDAVRV